MNRDVDNNILHVGDKVLIIGGDGEGEIGTISAIEEGDQFVRVAFGRYHHRFGKYPYNVRLLGDPDLQVDEGL